MNVKFVTRNFLARDLQRHRNNIHLKNLRTTRSTCVKESDAMSQIMIQDQPAVNAVQQKKSNILRYDEPPTKKRRFAYELEKEEIEEEDAEIKTVMKQYWSSIRTFARRGRVQGVFNFFYNRDFKELKDKIANRIFAQQRNRFKINYSLAYILRYIETDVYRYYHASFNNNVMLDTAVLISNNSCRIWSGSKLPR